MLPRLIGILLALPFVYGIALLVARDYGGEVVELETQDERGSDYRTSLWVVDLYGEIWLRANDPDAAWVQRLEQSPEVVLVRDGERVRFEATFVEDFDDRINAGMREKYGLADRLLSTRFEPEEVLAIRLEEP